jgi:uncharacterized protein (DUF488 family)
VPATLLTVGHSSHELELFLALLAQHEVTAIADVRTRPYSGYSPHFSADRLAGSLQRAGILYVPMGDQLGGQPEDEQLWRDGRPDFAAMAQQPQLSTGLDRLAKGLAAGQRICLLCSEEDPAACHRHRLLWPLWQLRGQTMTHIRKDGRLEAPSETDARVPPVMRRQWQGALFE